MMTKPRSTTLTNLKLLAVLPVIALVLAAFASESEILQSTEISENLSSVSSNGTVLPQFLPPPPENANKTEVRKISAAKKISPEPFVVVEEMPQYPGGPEELLKYIAEHIVYPSAAKENNIQGRIIVRFAVSPEGKVVMPTVLRGVNAELDNEALRVVKSLPDFRPGRQGGKAVPVWYMVPITFTLR